MPRSPWLTDVRPRISYRLVRDRSDSMRRSMSLTLGAPRPYPRAASGPGREGPAGRAARRVPVPGRMMRVLAPSRSANERAPVDVKLVDVVKRYGEAVAVDHINLEVETGEFFSLLGSLRLREDHHPADDRRVRAADVGPDRAERRGRHVAAAVQAARQHGLPELRPVPAPRHLREHRVRPAPLERQTTPRSSRASRRCSSSSSCPASSDASRPRSPAGRPSASRSRARSSTVPRSCSSTNRSAPST